MGFGLYGIAPESKTGEYFRNNIWWWHSLADYVLLKCADLFKEGETIYWHTNDGQEVSKETAKAISERLNQLVSSGLTKEYEDAFKTFRNALPDEKCWLCHGTGERHDHIIQGECNACHGKGVLRPSICSDDFSTENVKEFAEFCAVSGGFTIC